MFQVSVFISVLLFTPIKDNRAGSIYELFFVGSFLFARCMNA